MSNHGNGKTRKEYTKSIATNFKAANGKPTEKLFFQRSIFHEVDWSLKRNTWQMSKCNKRVEFVAWLLLKSEIRSTWRITQDPLGNGCQDGYRNTCIRCMKRCCVKMCDHAEQTVRRDVTCLPFRSRNITNFEVISSNSLEESNRYSTLRTCSVGHNSSERRIEFIPKCGPHDPQPLSWPTGRHK